MRSSSPALAKGPWGQSRSMFTGSVLAAYQRPGDRSDTGSDQGGMSEGHSDPNTGSTAFPCCIQQIVVIRAVCYLFNAVTACQHTLIRRMRLCNET